MEQLAKVMAQFILGYSMACGLCSVLISSDPSDDPRRVQIQCPQELEQSNSELDCSLC